MLPSVRSPRARTALGAALRTGMTFLVAFLRPFPSARPERGAGLAHLLEPPAPGRVPVPAGAAGSGARCGSACAEPTAAAGPAWQRCRHPRPASAAPAVSPGRRQQGRRGQQVGCPGLGEPRGCRCELIVAAPGGWGGTSLTPAFGAWVSPDPAPSPSPSPCRGQRGPGKRPGLLVRLDRGRVVPVKALLKVPWFGGNKPRPYHGYSCLLLRLNPLILRLHVPGFHSGHVPLVVFTSGVLRNHRLWEQMKPHAFSSSFHDRSDLIGWVLPFRICWLPGSAADVFLPWQPPPRTLQPLFLGAARLGKEIGRADGRTH